MTAKKYAVVNRSTLVSDADCYTMWRATSEQLRLHVAPAWGMLPMESVFVTTAGQVPEGYYPVYVLDDPDMANALGYHTEDPGGKVYGRVFAAPVLKSGGTVLTGDSSVSATLSHEVIELFVDISVNLWADRGDNTLVAFEAADPVEQDSYAIRVPDSTGQLVDVSVSNFVLQAWFDAEATAPGTQYDWLRKVAAPLQMTAGGYVVVWDLATGKVDQVFASEAGRQRFAALRPKHPSGRAARRMAS